MILGAGSRVRPVVRLADEAPDVLPDPWESVNEGDVDGEAVPA